MSRVFVLAGAVVFIFLSGCTAMQGRQTAKLEAELAAARETARVSSSENARLKTDLEKTEAVAKDLVARLETSTRELAQLRSRYANVDAALLKDLSGIPGVAVDKRGAIQVDGLDGLSFELGGAELKAESVTLLQKLAPTLLNRPGLIYIDGHTDNVPVSNPRTKELYVDNLGLSLARAAAVARVLIDAKIPATRLIVRGFGDARPIDSNDTPEGRAKNRRVEIRLEPAEAESKN